MPISMTQHAPQMPAEAYEQITANVGAPLRESDGFISHAAEITPDGVTVTEVCETREGSIIEPAAVHIGGRS